MNIYPKGIFISIWHFSVQIKVHKENIRTNSDDTEVYSEPFKTSKMKFFAKLLNGFELLFSLLSKLLYTDAYSEPSQTSKMKLFAKKANSF